MMGFHKSFAAAGGGSTGDATANQWDIKNGKTAYIASGKVTGSGYFPAMMEFDGSTGYYSHASPTVSGNKQTFVCRFNRASFTGGNSERLIRLTATGGVRLSLFFSANDHATTGRRDKLAVQVQNSSGTNICLLWSSTSLADGANHTLFFGFDGDTGSAVFRVDGTDEDDTGNAERVAPTTGTLPTSSPTMFVGSLDATPTQTFGGELGFIGYRSAGGLSWSDFMQSDGTPKQLDESTWTEWGAQPLFWHESGKMDENKGSAGAMTASGTITLAQASAWS